MLKVIEKILIDKRIKFSIFENFIVFTNKNNQNKIIYENCWPVNSSSFYFLVKNKYDTHLLLKKNNIKSLDQHLHLFLLPGDNNLKKANFNFLDMERFCLQYNFKVVLKPNTGSLGTHVFKVVSREELYNLIHFFIKQGYSEVNISKFEEILFEFRCIVLFNKVKFIYSKQKFKVVGDGVSSLYSLIVKSYNYINNLLIEIQDLKHVLKDKEEKDIDFKMNLHNGVKPNLLKNKNTLYLKLQRIATESAKVLDMNFGAVDIAMTKGQELFVLEVNGGLKFDKFYESSKENSKLVISLYEEVINIIDIDN